MDSTKKFLLGSSILFGAFLAATTSSVQAFDFPGGGTPSGPPSAADCVERTGKTESECQEMMAKMKSGERPKMTVADCVERSGKTEAECQTMINGRKNGERPPVDGQKGERRENHGSNSERTGMFGGGEDRGVSATESLSSRAERQKTGRVQSFSSIVTWTEKIIVYLDSKDVDTSSVKVMLETLKTKIASATSAFDTYIASLKIWESDKSDLNTQAIATNKGELKVLLTEVKAYYRETLIPALRALIESVNE